MSIPPLPPSSPSSASARADLQRIVAEHGVAPVAGDDEAGLTTIPASSVPVWGFDWPRAARPRASAVLILVGELDDVPAAHDGRACGVSPAVDVLLTQRAAGLRTHAGQVAFPGGGVEAQDADVVATALREAQEETGLDPAGVEVLGVLPAVPVVVSGYVVHPVIGWWRDPSRVAVVDHDEATAVFRVPVADLAAPANRVRVRRPGGRRGETPGFLAGDRLVWGFTAALLSRVLELAGWDEPWAGAPLIDAGSRAVLEG